MENTQVQTHKVEIFYFLCEALSTTQRAYKYIDKLYSKDKEKYNKLAKQNKYYNIGNDGNIEQEYYFKKMVGIVSDINDDDIAWLLKMTYKKANQFIKQSGNNVQLSKVLKDKSCKKLSEDECNGLILAAYMLAIYEDKDIDINDKVYQAFGKTLVIRSNREKRKERYPLKYKNISKEEKKELRDIQLKLKNKYPNIRTDGLSYINVDYEKGATIDLKKMEPSERQMYPLEYLYDLEDICLTSLIGTKYLKDSEIQELICAWKMCQLEKEIDYNKLYEFMIPAIQIRYLLRAYKEAKNYFFKNLDEDLKEIVEKKDTELREVKQKNLLLQDENTRLKNRLENETSKLKEEIKILENKKYLLEKEISNRPDVNEELHQLRNLMFNLNKDIKEDDIEVDIEKINDLKAICFGGNNNWISNMKEVLPNWIFIAAGVENFDTNLLKDKDYIFINTIANSHGMYYRIIENKEKHTKLRYINSLNRDRVLKEIEKGL